MSDEQKKTGNADLSELAPELPGKAAEVSVTKTPISLVEDGDTKGEGAVPAMHADGTPMAMPTKISVGVTGEEQLRKAQCKQKPCGACGHAQYLQPGTPRFQVLVLEIQRLRGIGVIDQRGDWNPAGFVWCSASADIDKESGLPMGAGYRFLGHNCMNWVRRRTDLLPDWMPSAMKTNLSRIFVASDLLREKGVLGYLSWMRRTFLTDRSPRR
jgi:hypothetical protein